MSLPLLEITMKMQTGQVDAALKSIESGVDTLINKVKQFTDAFAGSLNMASQQVSGLVAQTNNLAASVSKVNNTSVFAADQLNAASQISLAMADIAKLSGVVTAENLKTYTQLSGTLDKAILFGQNLQATGKTVDGMTDAINRQKMIFASNDKFMSSMRDFTVNNYDTIKKIMANDIKNLGLNTKRNKLMNDYVKNIKAVYDSGVDINKELGISQVNAKKLIENWDTISSSTKKSSDNVFSMGNALGQILRIAPQLAIIKEALFNPLEMIGKELNRTHELWNENHQAANNFLKDGDTLGNSLYKQMVKLSSAGGMLRESLTKAGFEVAGSTITMDQAQAGLNATLQSSRKNVALNSQELMMHAGMATQTSMATGIATSELADLSLAMRAMHKPSRDGLDDISLMNEAMADSAVEMNILTNVSAKYRLSVRDMSALTGLVNKDMLFLNNTYKDVRSSTGELISPTAQYTGLLAMMGNAATKAGQSGTLAMEAFSSALNNPLDNILLLGNAAFSNNINEQFMAIGENAARTAKQMEGLSPAMQQIVASTRGKTVQEIKALAASYEELGKQFDLKSPKGYADAMASLADKNKAADVRASALTDTMNNLNAALDGIKSVFGSIAVFLSPVINWFAKLISTDVGKWTVITAGGILAVVAAVKSVSMIMTFSKAMQNLAGSTMQAAAASKAASAGSGVGGLVDSLKAFDSKAMMGALRGAVGLAAVGVALAVGLGAIGLALRLMPKDKMLEFAEVTVGLIGATAVVALMSKMAPQALAGAVAFGAVGLALGVGLAAVGAALQLMPAGKMTEFIVMTTGLVAATAILSLMGATVPLALAGAVGLIGVSAALGLSIAGIGLALRLMPPGGVEAFVTLATGLVTATAIMTALGAAVPLALAGAVGLVSVGAALAVAIGTIGAAFMLFDPIKIGDGIAAIGRGVGSITEGAGTALAGLAAGLVAFAGALAGGGILSFFSGGIVENATKMADAITRLVTPIAQLGGLGDKVGTSFTMIADGLDKFSTALGKGNGFFGTDFKARAVEMASALEAMAAPLAKISAAQNGVAQDQARAFAKVQAEEIKSALAVSIKTGDSNDSAVLTELKAIKSEITKVSESVNKSSDVNSANLKKIADHTRQIMNEVLGGSFGGSTSNNNYT